MISSKTEEIQYINYNQDQGCFAVGTDRGFKIYNTYPFKLTYSRDLGEGIGIIEMLYRCNILALVGGGKHPKYPNTKLMLWDDHQVKIIGEMSFRSEVKAVRLKADRIVVVLENKIFVYNFSDLKLLDHIETCSNLLGLCSINTDGQQTFLAAPDKTIGWVNIQNYDSQKNKQPLIIKSHQSQLNCLQLNQKGTKLATASQKGTIIRLYETEEGQALQELRRGSEYAQIYSIAFDLTNQFLACSSDSGTIHIFGLKLTEKEKQAEESKNVQETKNPKSKFQFMKVFTNYFDSEWSLAQFRVVDNKTKVTFGSEPNSIVVLSYDGNYYQATFDPINGGECLKQSEQKIIKNEE